MAKRRKPDLGSRHIEAFLEAMAAERGAARNTLDAYQGDLRDFAAFVVQRGTAAEAADTAALRDYLGACARAGLSARTAARRLSALRQFHRYLYAEGIRRDDPTATLDSPRQGRTLPKVLSEEETEELLAAARAGNGPDAARRTALLEILYATGLRVSELVGLKLSSLSRDRRFLTVRGKGGYVQWKSGEAYVGGAALKVPDPDQIVGLGVADGHSAEQEPTVGTDGDDDR